MKKEFIAEHTTSKMPFPDISKNQGTDELWKWVKWLPEIYIKENNLTTWTDQHKTNLKNKITEIKYQIAHDKTAFKDSIPLFQSIHSVTPSMILAESYIDPNTKKEVTPTKINPNPSEVYSTFNVKTLYGNYLNYVIEDFLVNSTEKGDNNLDPTHNNINRYFITIRPKLLFQDIATAKYENYDEQMDYTLVLALAEKYSFAYLTNYHIQIIYYYLEYLEFILSVGNNKEKTLKEQFTEFKAKKTPTDKNEYINPFINDNYKMFENLGSYLNPLYHVSSAPDTIFVNSDDTSSFQPMDMYEEIIRMSNNFLSPLYSKSQEFNGATKADSYKNLLEVEASTNQPRRNIINQFMSYHNPFFPGSGSEILSEKPNAKTTFPKKYDKKYWDKEYPNNHMKPNPYFQAPHLTKNNFESIYGYPIGQSYDDKWINDKFKAWVDKMKKEFNWEFKADNKDFEAFPER
ncbi:hypothetical protein [Mycoplasma crocodyli]|nr:hypothetical protein [Mycoplasma crocodyli]